MISPELPPQASYLQPLVGRWEGEGEGLWSADPPFRYWEEVTFEPTGKPFLAYRQRTRALDDGRPMHAETGYVRATGDGAVEMLIVQPTGFAEIHRGELRGPTLDLRLLTLARSPSAMAVTDLRRTFIVGDESLEYVVAMAMNHEPIADHLRGQLRRK